MNIIETKLCDVYIFEPKVFEDSRGYFMESYNHQLFSECIGREVSFVQDNHSKSSKGVLRGLHYQINNTQGKLVRVVSGRVLDVAVDLRVNSPTFKKWASFELSDDNKKQLWIPEGFAHGFLAMSDNVDFLYKTTDYYSPRQENTILWNDPELGIDWGMDESELIISEKDKNGLFLKDSKLFK